MEYADVPPSSTNPGTQPSSNAGTRPSSNAGTQPSSDPSPASPLDLGLVAGVAGSVVVLVLVIAVCLMALVIWWR